MLGVAAHSSPTLILIVVVNVSDSSRNGGQVCKKSGLERIAPRWTS